MSTPEAQAKDLEQRKALQSLAALISNVKSLDELLHGEPVTKIGEAFEAVRVTVYALDTRNNQLYSIAKTGAELKEIRVEKKTSSVAGFVALAKKSLNIRDVYDSPGLTRIHPKLMFDSRWDEASGFRTQAMLTAPILYERNVIGILQLVNKKAGGPFSPREQVAAEEVANQIGMALYQLNRARSAKSGRRGKWDALIDEGAIGHDDLQKLLEECLAQNKDPGRALIEKLGIARDKVEKSLSAFFDCETWRLGDGMIIPEDLRTNVRIDYFKQNGAAPVERRGSAIVVVIDDPHDIGRTDAMRRLYSDRQLVFMVGFRDEIVAYIDASFGVAKVGDVGSIIRDLSSSEGTGVSDDAEDAPAVAESDSAIIKLVNQIIIDAFRRGTSDIHIEPQGKEAPCRIRFRIDGDCVEYQEVPSAFRQPLVARIKIMAMLDIAEKRKPQDGKIKFNLPDRKIELRVATVPVVGGDEDVVMRILAASKPLPIDQMGLLERNLTELKTLLKKPYGLFLCVGPTGSGKTTTLHSALGSINTVDMKIWTAEDPVEITQRGLRQVQMQPKIGLNFATAMRAFLRADPDVIMVGEMRDHETAAMGIEASLTGHLVVSTLHTNSAPETVTRLIDMGLDPFSFADALLGIVAQRLARGLCKKCKEPVVPSDADWGTIVSALGEEAVQLRGLDRNAPILFKGKGCESCSNSGYKGRVGIHELLVTNDALKRAISTKQPVEKIRDLAIEQGMTTLLMDGIEKSLLG
ncbi:MAG: GspE/PulE family protein, partial [Deltaproteobacteria bacterium]|nr:GspE/PulE family protein [Deltaproteobacteria bacterium]